MWSLNDNKYNNKLVSFPALENFSKANFDARLVEFKIKLSSILNLLDLESLLKHKFTFKYVWQYWLLDALSTLAKSSLKCHLFNIYL